MITIPIRERSNLYPEIVYTPTDTSGITAKIQEESINPLDWARGVTSSTNSPEVDTSTETPTDTPTEKSTGSYWDAWKDAKKKEETKPEEAKTKEIPADITYTGKGFEDFKTNYTSAGADPKKFDFFASLAKHESGFNPTIQNRTGAPAFGYFQFMQDGKRWNNITKFAGVDISTFRNNPVIQIQAAEKLANSFLSQFTEADKKRARELGYTDSALVRGAWLGGVGGVRNFLHKGINADDKHWDKKTHKGADIKGAMDRGNNYFKKGGILNANI